MSSGSEAREAITGCGQAWLQANAPQLAREANPRRLEMGGVSVQVAESYDVHIAGLSGRTYIIERGSVVAGGRQPLRGPAYRVSLQAVPKNAGHQLGLFTVQHCRYRCE